MNQPPAKKALSRLEDHNLIHVSGGTYKFTDSFFRQWILKGV